jgi:YD repeat-containing protein
MRREHRVRWRRATRVGGLFALRPVAAGVFVSPGQRRWGGGFLRVDTVTPGDLAEIDDRGARTKYAFDLRGRVTSIQRQIATPTGSDTLTQRYAATTFSVVAYSAVNAPLTESTGANASALMVPGGSMMTYAYTNDGRLQSLTSSYGPLIASATYDASGALTNEVLGDRAATTIDAACFRCFDGPGRADSPRA